MGIVVDRWGNVWDEDDEERTFPAWPHPELEGPKQKCHCPAPAYVYRTKRKDGRFEWRCGHGKVFPDLHH